ncbi:MAG: hypothetical protein MK102_01195 [Fuerstiella sp.]|nr:hypothetical protein [Fuerstiella sp.]
MIRLFTFDRLSLLREDGTSTLAMRSAVDSLSAVTTTFDCHLLQRISGDRPLDALGTNAQQTRLRAAVADRGMNVTVVASVESAHLDFPDWMNTTVRTGVESGEVATLISPFTIDVQAPAVEWIHLVVSTRKDELEWIAASLDAARTAVSACPGDMLMVTAVGGETADCDRFESLLWEGGIRVPLWIRHGEDTCRRVCDPTGSFDVLHTMLSNLDTSAEEPSATQLFDLNSEGRVSEELPPREIHLVIGDCDAVRTQDFLFVRSRSAELGEKTALYGKPHDVWNVHDLSHEYPDVVDELLARLPQCSD